MANGNGKFKMGRFGWMWLGIFGTALLFLTVYKFKNPFPAWMSKNGTPKTGDPCQVDATTAGTIKADGTCSV